MARLASISDFRPINVLPCVSKALERVLNDQLVAYVLEHDIDFPRYPVRISKGICTAMAVLLFGFALVFLDFSKTFDTISHQLLRCKLSYFGLHADAVKLPE